MAATAVSAERLQRAHQPISVLLVDDSAVARAAMSRMVEGSPDLRLAAIVDSAESAIARLREQRVDVIVLDLMMPGLDGISALPELLATGRGTRVLVVSSTARAGAEATLRALAAGASDTLAKPDAGHLNQTFGAVLVERIVRLGRAGRHDVETHATRLRPAPVVPAAVVGIAASTGGLRAIGELFAALPQSFDAPILLTQHLPTSFMPYFADQVAAMSGRVAYVARAGHALRRGEVAIAPGNGHLLVERVNDRLVIGISDAPAVSRCLPSADPMFASIASACGAEAVAVVLSGMGRDGCRGAEALAASHAAVFVQDAATSAVWGMPGAVAKAGLASAIGAPRDIAIALVKRGAQQ